MRILCKVLRVIGILVGLFLVAAGLASIFGLTAGFDEIPLSLAERLLPGVAFLVFGIMLVLPQTLFLRDKRRLFLGFGYVALIVAALPFAILGVVAYYEGDKHWLIIPASVAVLAVAISNALVFWYLGRHSRPPSSGSTEPRTLRG